MARPSEFTKEVGDKVCQQIANGLSMRSVCAPDEMPDMSTVFRWLRTDEEFCKQYARATEERTEAQNEMLLELGDEAQELAQNVDPKAANAVVSAVKLKADNLKWVMSKMKPKKYGDKLDLTSGGEKLPQPIINVQPHNGHKEDNEPQ
jgi:hypothetical protein